MGTLRRPAAYCCRTRAFSALGRPEGMGPAGAITSGSSATVELIVRAPVFATTLTNTATVSGAPSDPIAGNNTASENTTVVTNTDRLCYAVADGGNLLTEIDGIVSLQRS